jgi:6-phosphofructokinase 2
MADVVTLTMNPAIDLSVSVERVTPFHKLRSSEGRRDPGGGGINVARVLKTARRRCHRHLSGRRHARPLAAAAG